MMKHLKTVALSSQARPSDPKDRPELLSLQSDILPAEGRKDARRKWDRVLCYSMCMVVRVEERSFGTVSSSLSILDTMDFALLFSAP